jgi:hypothetical protein
MNELERHLNQHVFEREMVYVVFRRTGTRLVDIAWIFSNRDEATRAFPDADNYSISERPKSELWGPIVDD